MDKASCRVAIYCSFLLCVFFRSVLVNIHNFQEGLAGGHLVYTLSISSGKTTNSYFFNWALLPHRDLHASVSSSVSFIPAFLHPESCCLCLLASFKPSWDWSLPPNNIRSSSTLSIRVVCFFACSGRIGSITGAPSSPNNRICHCLM